MLINDFYNCHDIEAHENEYGCRIVFNAAHDIFKGHFPGQPVVPGVCMMEMVKELLLYNELNITEISYKMHYSSVAHLSTQFKKITHISPSEYKQQNQKRTFMLENV